MNCGSASVGRSRSNAVPQYTHIRASIVADLYSAHRQQTLVFVTNLPGVDCSNILEAMCDDFEWLESEGWVRRTDGRSASFALTEKAWRWADEQETLGLLRQRART